jgi:hypothetical protein
MWRLLTVLEFIAFPAPKGCEAHCLQFEDESIYLVRVEGDSSIASEHQYTPQQEEDLTQYLD